MPFSEQYIRVHFPYGDEAYNKLKEVLESNFQILPSTDDMFESDIRIGSSKKKQVQGGEFLNGFLYSRE